MRRGKNASHEHDLSLILLRKPDPARRRPLLGVTRSLDRSALGRSPGRAAGANAALAIAQRQGIPDIVARVLAGRGVDADQAPAFLTPTLRSLMPDPSVLTDMDRAATRIADAIIGGASIAVFGDYDVDGATSVALFARFLRHQGREPILYIPDRIFEGYGPNTEALRTLAAAGATLVITVDCGSTSFEALAAARDLGLDVVVLDHHQLGSDLPPAAAVVNPNRQDDLSGLSQLAAVGVAYLTVVAVNRELRRRGWYAGRPEPELLAWLDLVALGTICDVVPLIGLNRAFVAKGLITMARRENLVASPRSPTFLGLGGSPSRRIISAFCSVPASMLADVSAIASARRAAPRQ